MKVLERELKNTRKMMLEATDLITIVDNKEDREYMITKATEYHYRHEALRDLKAHLYRV